MTWGCITKNSIVSAVVGFSLVFAAIEAQAATLDDRIGRDPASVPADGAEDLDVIRLSHAKELLGKHYNRSIVKKAGEEVSQVGQVEQFIEQWTERGLSGWKAKSKAKRVAAAIISEAGRYKFDPVFLMAVIQNESSFNPRIVGKFGEIGLMQIRPATAKWISKKYGLVWKGPSSLYNPVTNVRIGAAYLSFLREQFDSDGRLYLAAYNMGAKNVKSALERQVRPREYPERVMQRYVRYYSELRDEIKAQIKLKAEDSDGPIQIEEIDTLQLRVSEINGRGSPKAGELKPATISPARQADIAPERPKTASLLPSMIPAEQASAPAKASM